MRLFFATDVHGSDRCFVKFVNAAAFYGVDVLVLGGDITGKAIVPLLRERGGYRARFLGEEHHVAEGPDADELEKKIANTGYYAWRCEPEEELAMRGDPDKIEAHFLALMLARLRRWLALAEDRLRPRGVRCLINAGNDDPAEVDAVLQASAYVEFLEGRVVALPDGTELVSCGYANQTPWQCPRDVDEDTLAQRLERVIEQARDPGKAIFNFHCPPYDTMIDSGPALGPDLRLTSGAGGVEMRPVGSTSCRAAIERYQPLLGLHGHLHESRGTVKLGRTVCINPGSEYSEGILRGALIEIKKGKLQSYQLTSG